MFPTPVTDLPSAPADLGAEVENCLPVLPVLAQQLRETAREAEAAIVRISTRFQAIEARIWASLRQAEEAIRSQGAEAAHGAQQGLCDLVRTTLERLQKQVSRTVANSRDIAQQMQTTSQVLRGIGSLLDDVDRIASRARLLAFNSKLEAARAGEQGKAFAVVADQTRAMAEHAGQTTAAIRDMIGPAMRQVAQTAQALLARAEADQSEALAGAAEVDRVLAIITVTEQSMLDSLRNGQALSRDLVSDITAAVMALQFQDAMKQRIDHVVQALDDMYGDLTAHFEGRPAPTASDRMERLRASFTMASEHQVIAPPSRSAGAPPANGLGDNVELF